MPPIPVNKNKNPNCIENSSFCIRWDGGDIEILGICDGDNITNVILEIIHKLQEIAGQDLSSFDIDTLLQICNQRAPLEKNLISILEIISSNQVCLKDYIDTLNETLIELSKDQKVNINLKCLADFDNFGNQLSVTRETLDQMVIDKLCNHETRITTVEGKVTSLQNQVNNVNNNVQLQEPEFTTCVDPASKPTSGQVVSIANKVCSIESYLGNSGDASVTRSNFNFEDSRYNLISGWLLGSQRQNILDDLNNAFLVIKDLEARIIDIQSTCCAPTCDKIQIGFSIVAGDDEGDYIVRFRATDGNNLFGFVNNFSKIKFSGTSKIDGSIITTAELPVNIEDETGEDNSYALGNTFDISKPITVILSAKLIKDGLSCEKCISQKIDTGSGCPVCEILAGGTKGGDKQITITYEF